MRREGNSTEKFKKLLPDILTAALVTIMVFASEITGEKEIIFPEITALAVGYMVAGKRSWMVNSKRMLALITGCAVLGVLIVLYLPFDTPVQMVIAFAIGQVLFLYSGTTFAPFVSALVLPVMLGTRTWVYPVAAFLLTLAVILCHDLFLKLGIRADEPYRPVVLNSRRDVGDMLLRVLLMALVALAAFRAGWKFVVAPPLLVAFTEFSRPRNKTRNKPVKTVLVLTGCALAGALCRGLVTVQAGLPLTLAALLTAVLMLAIVHGTGMFMPPSGAVAVLSLLIPQESLLLFPAQIFVGGALFMWFSRLLFMKRQVSGEHEVIAK